MKAEYARLHGASFRFLRFEAGLTRLTVAHELEGVPQMAAAVSSKFNTQGGGGWSWILSDLKTLLETGETLAG